MAHSNRRRNKNNEYNFERETNDFTNQRLLKNYSYKNLRREPLRVYEDRREYHPQGSQRPARSFRATNHRLRVVGIPVLRAKRPEGARYNFHKETWDPLPYRIGFVKPDRILICVRRKIRREVLNAMFGGGLGAASKLFKKPKYNEYSSISC